MFETSVGLIFFAICFPYLCQAFSSEEEERPKVWNMTAEMIKAGIIPKVLPQGPEQFLQVFLPHGSLEPGTKLLHEHAISIPGFVFQAPNDTWHSLFIVVKENWDPEEKLVSRSYNVTPPVPVKSEWHELVVLNIPGNEYMRGKTVLDYDPPYHDLEQEIVDLFLFVVYRQPHKFDIHRKTSMITRNNTVLASLSDYVRFYNLTGPVAGNFMYRYWLHPPGFQTPIYPILEIINTPINELIQECNVHLKSSCVTRCIIMLRIIVPFCLFLAIMAKAERLSDSDFDWSMFLRFDVKNKMIEHKITPTAVPVAPIGTCHVHFHWGEPEPGQVVPEDLDKVARPTVTWSAKNESLYLMMSYCITNWFEVRDAPEQGRDYRLHEWVEWIIYNVHKQKIFEGSDLYDYQPCPVPQNKTVKHLVIYLVFKQNETIHIPGPTEISWSEFEARTTVSGFINRYKLGTPVAANFYYIRYDKQRKKDTFKDSVAEWERVLSYENLETKEEDKV